MSVRVWIPIRLMSVRVWALKIDVGQHLNFQNRWRGWFGSPRSMSGWFEFPKSMAKRVPDFGNSSHPRSWGPKPSPTSILEIQMLTDIDFEGPNPHRHQSYRDPNPHRHRFWASKPSPTSILGIKTFVSVDFEDVDFQSETWECHDLILVILGTWTGDSNDVLGILAAPTALPLAP